MSDDIDLHLKFDKVFLLDDKVFFDKYLAHKTGKKHLAFSLFLFDNTKKYLLLQKRADSKMIFPSLWTNTCCSHPVFEYNSSLQVNTRLFQEFGFYINRKDITKILSIKYQAQCRMTNLIENEIDDIYIGLFRENLNSISKDAINQNEISAFKWVNFIELVNEIQNQSSDLQNTYTPWFLKVIKSQSKQILRALSKIQ